MAAGVGKNVASNVKNIFLPGRAGMQKRAYDALEKSIGEPELSRARQAMDISPGSALPQTTAAMTNSGSIGALERGARSRGLVDFNPHDEAVARAAWGELQPPPGGGSEAGDILRSKFMIDDIPQTPRQFGEGRNAVPEITSHPLRKALGQYSRHMDIDEADKAIDLADDLTKRELFKRGEGAITPDVKKWTDHIPMAIGAITNTKTLGMSSVMMNRARANIMTHMRLSRQDKIMKEIDDALLDPDKFKTMVDEVRARILKGETLTKTDRAIKYAAEELALPSRAGAASTDNKGK